MSLKKPRTHNCGFSNIDFRSKGDLENLKLYEPWKIPKEFGTMGKSGYYPSYTEYKKIFSVSKNINKLKNIVQGSPDPKTYPLANFYKKNRIKPNILQDFLENRVASLDEISIGKEKYTGDSMMISDIVKFRKEKKYNLNEPSFQQHKNQQEFLSKIKKRKNLKEISLDEKNISRNLELSKTLDNKVDLRKIQNIRLLLRKRYSSRDDIRKIFKEWDLNAAGEISLYSVHEMINRLSIPINFNETRALIASSNTRGTESLNMEEFIHLIFSDNEILKVDLGKLKYKDEKLYKEGKESENYKILMRNSLIEMNKSNQILNIKQQIHNRTTIIQNVAIKNNINLDKTSKNDFIKLMQSMKFPEKYYRDILIDSIFKTYINPDNETMNMNKFCIDCLNEKDDNNFLEFKDRLLTNFSTKIDNQLKEKDITILDLKPEKEKRLSLVTDLTNQIIENNIIKKNIEEKENNKIANEVLSTQPSTNFINHIYKDHKKMYEELNKVEEKFCTKPNIVKTGKGKTRFNGNPQHKDTFYMINQDPRGSSYINEEERFNISGMNNLTSFIRNDKEKRKMLQLAKLKKIREYENERELACHTMEKINEQKDLSAQNKRSIRQNDYEVLNRIRNDFIE